MSKNTNIYHYFVEGVCEEKLINELKTDPYFYFKAGKVEVFNFINKKISDQRLAALKRNTIIILVYDIDVAKVNTLEENIKKLNKFGFKVHHIQSIRNFEDEIVVATGLPNIYEIYGTKAVDDFKKSFIKQPNCVARLCKNGFKMEKIWSRVNNTDPFGKYSNQEDLDFIRKK